MSSLIWSAPDHTVAWVTILGRILERYDEDCPQQFRHGNWRKVFPDPHFGEVQLETFPHAHTDNAQQVIIERMKSWSYIARLSATQQAKVLGELKTLIASEPTLRDQPEITLAGNHHR